MKIYSRTHLSDPALTSHLATGAARESDATADFLADIAEFDARRLYAPAGYDSMFAYCVGELGLSEDAAFKRIRAARAARRCPVLFAALAAGRLHLSAIVMLAPHLTPENADDLLAAAARRSKTEIERLLAERFPRPDLPGRVETIPTQLAPGPVGEAMEQLAPGPVASSAPGRIEAPVPPARVTPLAPERIALQLTIDQSTHDDLRYAQALLSHELPSGDVAKVLGRALKALIGQLEKRKFAATRRPRGRQRHPIPSARHVPADVKRAVWERDGGRCTFVSDAGHRCGTRKFLEFDHIDPVARGGEATANRMRLRCRAHNQYEADRTFGTDFMSHKRQAARHAATEKRAKAAAAKEAQTRDVIPWLRALGFRADEARSAAAPCESIPNASLEERVRMAPSFFHPRSNRHKAEPRSLGRPIAS